MQRLALAMLLIASVARADDATSIVLRSLDRDWTNFEHLKNYTYNERAETREYDKKGKLKSTEIETNEIMILGGRHYGRLIARDDKPLSEKQARKEQEKLDKELAKRQNMSAADKAKLDKERAEERKILREIPEAFTLRLVGEETISDKPAWVIDATPKPGFHPKESRAKLLSKIHGKIWIDKAEYQWVKAEGEVIDTLSFGFGMFRIAPGGSIHFEQARVNQEVWLPSRVTIRGDARVALLKKLHGEVDITYRDYKKFQTESRIVE